jgi:hypothetical protein
MSCAVVLYACSRRVFGWSLDAAPTAALVTNALGKAIVARLLAQRPNRVCVVRSGVRPASRSVNRV